MSSTKIRAGWLLASSAFVLLSPGLCQNPSSNTRLEALPLSFEPNRGQADAGVRFVAHGRGYGMALLPDGAAVSLAPDKSRAMPGALLSLRLAGSNPSAKVEGADRLPGHSSYFFGTDAAKWRTEIPQFGRVRYRDVYPGVDLVYYGRDGRLEYDFVVAPGADPKAVVMKFDGYRSMRLDRSGDLVFETAGGQFRHHQPVAYQEFDGERKPVKAGFLVRGKGVRFEVGSYDRTRPLVIDPVLSFSTFLGGVRGDMGAGIAVDAQGNIWVTGTTASGNFLTKSAYQSTNGGNGDVFLSKLDSTGSFALFSTFLGGSGTDRATAIALDGAGNACLTGYTSSDNFPVTNNAFRRQRSGTDVFVTCVAAGGTALIYSTLVGGSGDDRAYGIALDAANNAYVAGETSSTDYPVNGGVQTALRGGTDAFVTKLNAGGSALLYSTYLGGAREDKAWAIAVDSNGSAYVAGHTYSSDFPLANAFQNSKSTTDALDDDAWVAKLNPAGNALVYSTYLGSSSTDRAYGIAVDSSGNAYVTGETGSRQFPTTTGSFQPALNGVFTDAFVTKFNPQGSALVYSTFLGGSRTDGGRDIAVDSFGQAYVTGYTWGPDFPLVKAVQTTYGGDFSDAFVAQLSADGRSLLFSSYLGGGKTDNGGLSVVGPETGLGGIAVDQGGNVYVTGRTDSEDFPVANAIQPAFGGRSFAVGDLDMGDAFVVKIGTGGSATTGLRFVSATPCRVADTRNSSGTFGGPAIPGGTSRDFPIPTSACSIPADAAAYSLNITVVPRGMLAYLSVYPAGAGQPLVSTLNSFDGRIKANAAIVPAGPNGAITVFVTNTTDVIIDINGYFVSGSSSALAFYPVAPCRVSDTRNGQGTFGGPSMAAGQTRSFPIPQSNCNVPASAAAYSLNVTVVPQRPLGYLSLWPAGQSQPLVSTLNSPTGAILANAAIVPAGSGGGAVSVYVTDNTDVILDINGYFAPPGAGGLSFHTATPCRIADTRNPQGAFGGPSMSAGQSRDFNVPSSPCGIPAAAQAFSLNATVVPPGSLAYLTLWPQGGQLPLVSTLNAFDASITANAAIVPASAAGSISAFVTNPTDLILDINGYFAP